MPFVTARPTRSVAGPERDPSDQGRQIRSITVGSGFSYPDTSGWIEWQKEYRYGALFIFPPAGIIERVDALRRTYDPKPAAAAPAHISLSEPLPGPLTEGQVEELRKALMRVQPFEVHFGPLRDFPPYPGVAFAITPEEPFMELREAVHATTIFRDSQLARRDIAPHMTIAEFITLEETARMLESLRNNVREGDWLVTSIEYAIPDEKVHFHRVLTLPLGAR